MPLGALFDLEGNFNSGEENSKPSLKIKPYFLIDLLLWLTPFSFPHSPVTQIFLVSSLSVSFVQKNKDVLAMFKLPMPRLSTKVNLLQITFPLQNLPPFSYLETLSSSYF